MKRFILSVCTALLVAPLAAAQSYTIANLCSLNNTNFGYNETDGDAITHAFLWTEQGGMEDLGADGLVNSEATGINASGQVVGTASASTSMAFLWTSTDGMLNLGTLGGNSSNATGINDLGDVVGLSTTTLTDTFIHAFVWNAGRGMRDLGTLGGNNSGAWGVNNHRQLVGYSYLSGESVYHAFLWTSSGGMQDLGTLDGSYSVAAAISDSGAVVGSSTLPGDAVQHAFGPRVGACRIWELWEVPIPRPVASTNQAKLWAGLILPLE